jgi:hemoglobin
MSLPTGHDDQGTTLYDRVGGEPFFAALVERFYAGVAADEVLGPMYPEWPDLAPAADRLRLFLVQYWGGPTTYSEQRGHPRLRARHLPFRVDADARDRWLRSMLPAIRETCDALDAPDDVAEALVAYVVMAANAMQNAE